MRSPYLASGFGDVDRAADRKAFADCLTLLDSLPYYQETKRRGYELLELGPGLSVLDVGCGLGDDARRLKERIGPDGRVVGVDASSILLAEARDRAGGWKNPSIEFVRADAARLPFPANTFDRCRIDRVLQHLPDPLAAVSEMARILKPGGIMLAYDNDWETFSVNSPSTRVTAILKELWRDSFKSGRAGGRLEGYFRAAGVGSVRVYPGTSVVRGFELADGIYNLRETARRAADRGLIETGEDRRWIASLIAQSARGEFACSLTAYTVVGAREERREETGPGASPL